MNLFGWHDSKTVDEVSYLFLGIPIMTEVWKTDEYSRGWYPYEKRLFGITVWRAK